MLYNIEDIGGQLVKDNKQYQLFDNTSLKNLVVSKTKLRAGQSTNGHRHAGQEEVYIFTKGQGQMELDYKIFDVKEGDIVLIEDNSLRFKISNNALNTVKDGFVLEQAIKKFK